MKKLLQFSTICIIAAFLFSSCRSNVSATKRHYNNGYYVTHTKNKHKAAVQKEEEKTVQHKPAKSFNPAPESVVQNSIAGYSDQNPAVSTADVAAGSSKTKPAVAPNHGLKQTFLSKTGISEIVKNERTLFPQKKLTPVSGERDGLSLFWLVIVIILILWAVGFLAGGFGLGGLFNLLLVIALILLILWLLRII